MAKSTDLVTINQIRNRRIPCTSSRRIAQEFGIDHNYLLKKIAKLIRNGEIGEGTFSLTSYQDEWNRSQPMYLLDNDAVIVLLPSFTGKKARKKTQQFLRDFIRLSNRRIKNTGIPREKGDDLAMMYKTLSEMFEYARSKQIDKKTGLPKKTDFRKFSTNALNMNEASVGIRGKNEQIVQHLTKEGARRRLLIMSESIMAMAKLGITDKDSLFAHFESKGLMEKNPDITKYLTMEFLEVNYAPDSLPSLRAREFLSLNG